ncbi:MAG: EscU/YscU/HrcU family type III secretion system export apparatus switch protein [Bryobacteraceae bacterium]
MADGSKTEKPTPQRLKKAREKGQFLSARGFVGAIQYVAVVMLLAHAIPGWIHQVQLSTAMLMQRSIDHEIGQAEWIALLRTVFINAAKPLAATGAGIVAITLGTHLGITKMGFSLQRLVPKLDRFNPATRLRELPLENLRSVLEAAVLLAAVSVTVESFVRDHALALLRMPFESVPTAASQIGGEIDMLLWKAAAVFLVFGAVDLFRNYRKHMSTLNMSKEEIREEHKRSEGDPQIKARVRRLRRDLVRQQMLRDVKKATAVIVNPTHFAIAIRYEAETMACPLVVAKGRNWLALRIREIATEHQVPIVENPPLARALYDAVSVGRTIPLEFYKAVAEILAYIYRLMGHKLPEE